MIIRRQPILLFLLAVFADEVGSPEADQHNGAAAEGSALVIALSVIGNGGREHAITVAFGARDGLGGAALEEAATLGEGRQAQSEDDGEGQYQLFHRV